MPWINWDEKINAFLFQTLDFWPGGRLEPGPVNSQQQLEVGELVQPQQLPSRGRPVPRQTCVNPHNVPPAPGLIRHILISVDVTYFPDLAGSNIFSFG